MKILLTGTVFFLAGLIFSQTNPAHMQLAAMVSDFDTTGGVESSSFPGEVDIKNARGDVLRFKVNEKNQLQPYHGGIMFILYDFDSGWLWRINTYDARGNLKGDDEFGGIASFEIEIHDMGMLHAILESIDAKDGNLNTHDKDLHIVYKKNYSASNKLISDEYINSSDYWKMYHFQYRP